ncbi:MAG: transglutaminase-like domain-containing protein [Bacteroidota bacterium]
MTQTKACSIVLLLITKLLMVNTGFAQKEIILKRSIDLKAPPAEYQNKSCNYELLIPYNRLGKQEVLECKYVLDPKNLIKAPDGEVLAKWEQLSFTELQKTKLEVQIRLKLYVYDLQSAKRDPQLDKEDMDTVKYLRSEENLRSDSKKIQTTATTIKGNDREEIVHGIFDFVVAHLDYKRFEEQDRGAKKALEQGEGDCTEYAELMVTLCRARHIPARIQKGLVLKGKGQIGYHNWVEVYFEQYGWVAFDPTWADHADASTTFSTMRNTYIQLSNRRYIRHVFCSCSASEYAYSYKLYDSYTDTDAEEKAMSKRMYELYNSKQHEKTLVLLDSLSSFKSNLFDYNNVKGVVYARLGNFDKGIECLQASILNAKTNERKIQSFYAFANYFALKGDKEYTIMYLKRSIELGFKNYKHLSEDEDFVNMKDHPPFIELLNELKSRSEKK